MTFRKKFQNLMDFQPGSKSVKGEIAYWSKTLKNWYKDGLINFIDDYSSINGLPNGYTVLGNLLGRIQDPNKQIIDYDEVISGDISQYFEFDKNFIRVPINLLPNISTHLLEETEEYTVAKNQFGATIKTNKESMSYIVLDQEIKTEKDFEKFKESNELNIKDRLPIDFDIYIKEFKERDYILTMGGWPLGVFSFGRELLGLTDYLIKFYDDPGFITNILDYLSDYMIEIIDHVLKLINIDIFLYWEDMAFKNGPMVSPGLFQKFLMPAYTKINSVLKDYNVKNIWLDSDGHIDELIPLWTKTGITGIMPFEIQAGMDIVKIRKAYPHLQMIGGIDKKQISKGKSEIDKELEKVRFMLESGGYIPSIDHSVPPDISWENFKYYRKNLNDLIGQYYKK